MTTTPERPADVRRTVHGQSAPSRTQTETETETSTTPFVRERAQAPSTNATEANARIHAIHPLDALAEVRRLEAELETARIRAGLGPATSSPVVPVPVQVTGATAQPGLTAGGVTRVSHAGQGGVAGVRLPDGVTYKDIRAWADNVGIRTTPRGRLADDVVLRYIEAHPEAGAA